jgi:hypothetical protein
MPTSRPTRSEPVRLFRIAAAVIAGLIVTATLAAQSRARPFSIRADLSSAERLDEWT